jgi:MOSC domain-containing protein
VRISWISLTPVKGLAVEEVDEVELLEQGLRGDRVFFLVDENDRLVNNKGRRGPLQLVRGAYDEHADVLTLRLADGSEISGPVERGNEIVTNFHGVPVPARRAAGPWDEALSRLLGEEVRLVAPPHGGADRRRSGAATLLGESSLAAIADVLGVETVDPRRFRMNFGLEGLEPHAEDGWIGRRVKVGEAVVVPQGNVGRCAITTQNPGTGVADLDTLKALAGYRGDVETTEPLPFGVHAAVAKPGHVRVGDTVELL